MLKQSIRKENGWVKIVDSWLIDLPAAGNLNYWWNYGSLLGFSLVIQIITGILLAMHYCPQLDLAFTSVAHITRDVNYGHVLRMGHANGASIFFVCVYCHMGKGIYYGGYTKGAVWSIGVLMFLLMILTSFVGYVLPWGQMSYWAATVITNLLSAIPYVGDEIVKWVWGGFSISNATLNRLFSLHYLMPFVLAALVLAHLIALHEDGSGNSLGVNSRQDRVEFHPYYSLKDLYGIGVLLMGLVLLVSAYPYSLCDAENFKPANPMVTPVHIKPEWYFLFAYAILRSIPSKLGGVVALVASILVLVSLPYTNFSRVNGNRHRPLSKILYWCLVGDFLVLTWIGGQPVEEPYILIGQVASIIYFVWFLWLVPLIGILENKLLGI